MNQISFQKWCERNPSLTNCSSCQGHGITRKEKPCHACDGTGHKPAAHALYLAAIEKDQRLYQSLIDGRPMRTPAVIKDHGC